MTALLWRTLACSLSFGAAAMLGCDRDTSVATAPAAATGQNTPTGEIVPVGAVGRAPDYEMGTSVVEECDVPPIERNASRSRVGVEVTIRARTDVEVPANPYYALLLDGSQRVYEATLSGCEPALSARLVARGETARGWISFDVPEGSRDLTLAYLPRLVNGESEELLFALGR